MRANPVNLLIAVAISALLSYGLWSFDGSLKNYVAIGAFAFFAGTLGPMIGGTYEYARNAVNLRVVCGVFFIVGLIVNGFFSIVAFSAAAYIVVSAGIFLVYVLVANGVYGARQ